MAVSNVCCESLDFVGFLRWRRTIYTLFIPLEDRIGNQDVGNYKRNLDSNIGNCIIILTEPTTPLIFHAQPGGIFLFMGCFMYQYPKQRLTIISMLS